jgi:CBS-domain-containing membrane protein
MLRKLDRQEKGLKASMHIDRLEDASVRQVMTPKVATVSTGTTVAEAITRLLGASIHRLFVTGAKGKVIGLVSTMDIVRALHDRIQKDEPQ